MARKLKDIEKNKPYRNLIDDKNNFSPIYNFCRLWSYLNDPIFI